MDLISRLVIVLRNFTSRAMKPGFLGASLSTTRVNGRPSGEGAQFKAVRQFGDDADVGFAPPFAVGDDVEAGVFLHAPRRNGRRPAFGVVIARAAAADGR